MTAEKRLMALRKFSGLSQHNKLKLYKTTILPALTYPPVPLNSLTAHAQYKLQIAQNKALRFITNADRYTNNQTLHTTCNIDPINITLHKHAKHTWEKMKYQLPHIYTHLVNNTPTQRRNNYFLSSRLEAEGPTPTPIYTRTN